MDGYSFKIPATTPGPYSWPAGSPLGQYVLNEEMARQAAMRAGGGATWAGPGLPPPGPAPVPPAAAPGAFVGPRPMFEPPPGVRTLGPSQVPSAPLSSAPAAPAPPAGGGGALPPKTGWQGAAPKGIGARGLVTHPATGLALLSANSIGESAAGNINTWPNWTNPLTAFSMWGAGVRPWGDNGPLETAVNETRDYFTRGGVKAAEPPAPSPTMDAEALAEAKAAERQALPQASTSKTTAVTTNRPGGIPPAPDAATSTGALGEFDAMIQAAMGATPEEMQKATKALEDANINVEQAFAQLASKTGVPDEVSRGLDKFEKGMLLLQFGLGTMGAASRPGANTFGALAQGGQGALAGYEGIIAKREGRAKDVAQAERQGALDTLGFRKYQGDQATSRLNTIAGNADKLYQRTIDRYKAGTDARKAATDEWYKRGQLDNGRRLADAAMVRAQKADGKSGGLTFDFGDFYQQAIESAGDPAEAEKIAIDASLQVGVPLPETFGYQIGENGNLQVRTPTGGVHDTGRKPPGN